MSSGAEALSGCREVHVCFCADGRYVNFIVPAIESIVRSACQGTTLWVDLIVDHQPSAGFFELLELLCPGRHRVHVIRPDEFADLLEVTHISRGMYYRLLIPELVEAEKVLYLDCDVLVRKDLSALYATNLKGLLGAAVVNPFHDGSRLGLGESDVYFNSGVLLINTREWCAQDVKSQVLTFLRQNEALLRMPDQDALNVVMKGKWLELNPTYNCQVSMLLRHNELGRELSPRWQTDFLRDPAIMHFSAGHKQWHSSNRIVYSREYRSLKSHIMEIRRGILLDRIISLIRSVKFSRMQSNPYFF